MKPDINIPGFSLKAMTPLDEYKGTGIHLVHDGTGCEIFHINVPDEENLFSFCFSTPPVDGSGVTHIIEHCVLSGSKNFPVKDPFLELMKGSLNTFLNAMTYPDRTIYPASSTNVTDYFNLMSVYGDAVFFPLLRKEVFLQEGRRLEIRDDGTLEANGVVFNEMKGNYSSHDSIVSEYSLRTLFPDTPYQFDSGGEPAEILSLEYAQFLEYYRRHYHPGNCRIFLYGNIDTERQCRFLEERFLSKFSRVRSTADTPARVVPPDQDVPPVHAIPFQPRWEGEKAFQYRSPIGEGEDTAAKTSIVLNWLCGSVTDPETILGLEVLAEILLGNPGCPLYKGILDSKLGEDISPVSGIEADLRELVFSVGIRGSEPERGEKVRDMIIGILSGLAGNGIPDEIVEGSLRRVEFRYREIKGGVPFGLRLLGKTIRGWNYGQDPAEAVAFEKPFSAVRERSADPSFFSGMIRKVFLENPHRSLLVVSPGAQGLSDGERMAEERVRKIEKSLSAEDRVMLAEEGNAFSLFQEEEDTEEALASIPRLSRSDLPLKVETIAYEKTEAGGIPCHLYDFFTNGIVYIDIVADVEGLPSSLIPFLPLYSRVLCSGGLPGIPYDQVARSLALHSGGFSSLLEAGNMGDDPSRHRELLFFRMKTLERDLEQGFSLVSRLLGECDFSDIEHLRDLILEFRNDMKSSIIGSGSGYASLRAGAPLSSVYAREEEWKGISQYLFLVKLSAMGMKGAELAAEAFAEIRRITHRRERYTFGICGAAGGFGAAAGRAGDLHGRALELVGSFAGSLSEGTKDSPDTSFVLPEPFKDGHLPSGRPETLIIPSGVGYAAAAVRGAFFREEEYPYEQILSALLKTGFLWERIRMRGGAYGAGASSNGTEGIFSFYSYRDPQPALSFSAFRDSLLEGVAGIDPEELEQAVIGIVGKEIHPMVPGEKAMVAIRRELYGIADSDRQTRRDRVLAARTEHILSAGERLLDRYSSAVRVALAGRDQLDSLSRVDSGFRENVVAIPVA